MSATCSATYNACFFLSEIRMSDTPTRSSFRSEPPSRSLPVHSVIRPRSHRVFWGKRDFNCVKVCQKPGGLSNQRGHRVIMAAHAEHPVPTYPGGLRACATDSLARCQLFGRHSPWGLRERSQQVATLPAELFRSEIARRHAGGGPSAHLPYCTRRGPFQRHAPRAARVLRAPSRVQMGIALSDRSPRPFYSRF